MHAIGIDIGGTKIAGGVVDENGVILTAERVPTPTGHGSAITDAVVAMIERLAIGRPVGAAGVAAPGFVDAAQSTIYYTPNIPWRNEPLRQNLLARLPHLDITVDNDANAAGWAEYRFGAGRGLTDMTMLTIGTGVGGAIIVDGRLLRGGFGAAGEIGHLRLVPGGLLCGCGARGCIEQYGSGRALLRFANELADAGGVGLVLAEARREHGELDGVIVGDLIQAGDPGAIQALQRLGRHVGETCASLSAVLDPQVFVIGGGVAAAGDLLLDPIRAAYATTLPARGFRPEPMFRTAELVNDAGVVGAADLARSHATAAAEPSGR
ncbi:ROK family glucokinase [Galbitalea sp. SE-J8]|uniref:ROK family glucokinase n=1 Tax=Galbitalea sp. SE-J8 TaxID=3054952 RepID=UPI00259D2E7F|nr:ROK family glucokinase [Galbitalea sp. SE-J8]MDM4763069.1 ROK family glucokinase [Galbitalea sp. SE-J8]